MRLFMCSNVGDPGSGIDSGFVGIIKLELLFGGNNNCVVLSLKG